MIVGQLVLHHVVQVEHRALGALDLNTGRGKGTGLQRVGRPVMPGPARLRAAQSPAGAVGGGRVGRGSGWEPGLPCTC
eukprot:scaffold25560_cov146-Isochrysis_galbana.AAC.3